MIEKEPRGFVDPALVEWQPEAGIRGLHAKTLARCHNTGSYTRLLKFLPGTDTSPAGTQSHHHLEELWIVSGAIYDLALDQNFVEGMYANRLHHMDHGPWRSPHGAITFELRDMDADRQIAKEQLEFFDPSLRPWDEVDERAGVYVKTLTQCPRTGSYGRLVRFRPRGFPPVVRRFGRHKRAVDRVRGALDGGRGDGPARGNLREPRGGSARRFLDVASGLHRLRSQEPDLNVGYSPTPLGVRRSVDVSSDMVAPPANPLQPTCPGRRMFETVT